jgi:pyrophosphate--fructose-6-phosphate 1-phosphotransferase
MILPMNNVSLLQTERYRYQPKLPTILQGDITTIEAKLGQATTSADDHETIKKLFTHSYGKANVGFVNGKALIKNNTIRKVGLILSGGQAPGGHNVIAGLFDALKKFNSQNQLYGFLGGPSGLIDNHYIEITGDIVGNYRNTGGFDMIQSGRTKLEKESDFDKVLVNCQKLGISALVSVGGDDSNTNAAILAEYFEAKKAGIAVIGCPKTIDGDLKNQVIEVSFGFDTACKTFAELIGNIARDANSARKYWHFIRLMGRSASHITLECALLTQPNICLISEEVLAKKMSLSNVVDYITESVIARAYAGNNFGLVLIPEGLIEFIPEFKKLIAELNTLLALKASSFEQLKGSAEQLVFINDELSDESSRLFESLPTDIAQQLILDRDPHGNVRVSAIETEKLLLSLVEKKCDEIKLKDNFDARFSALGHFFGYEGRCAFPSNFDADYCYSLGYNACFLIMHGFTGYLSSIQNLDKVASQWQAGGVPLTSMMNIESRHGESKAVIRKALVELDGKPFIAFSKKREEWKIKTSYIYPGAIQYYGPSAICDQAPRTLLLEKGTDLH